MATANKICNNIKSSATARLQQTSDCILLKGPGDFAALRHRHHVGHLSMLIAPGSIVSPFDPRLQTQLAHEMGLHPLSKCMMDVDVKRVFVMRLCPQNSEAAACLPAASHAMSGHQLQGTHPIIQA